MDDVIDTLKKAAENFEDAKKILRAGDMASGCIRSHIARAQGFTPLSPATAAFRGSGIPLNDTGNLRDSITYEIVSRTTVSVGTVRKDAPIHNSGGTITAKKNWLFIPSPEARKFGARVKKPGEVLAAVRNSGCSVFRIGRTVCYSSGRTKGKPVVLYYLKKSVSIPRREFFYLSEQELNTILKSLAPDI